MINNVCVLSEDGNNIKFRNTFNKNEPLEEVTSKSTTVTNRQTSLTNVSENRLHSEKLHKASHTTSEHKRCSVRKSKHNKLICDK